MDIWKSETWKVFYSDKKVRTGLHTRFDTQIPPEIKWPCYMFCEWARDYYEFPIRVTIYFKASDTVRAMSGEQVSGNISGSIILGKEIQRLNIEKMSEKLEN